MSQKIAIFDIAGTLVDGNPWRGFLKHPLIPRYRVYRIIPVIYVLLFAKQVKLITDSQFRQRWIRLMASLLMGMTTSEVTAIFQWIVTDYMSDAHRIDIINRLKDHKSHGDYVVLVSGMFTGLTQLFADEWGADAGIGTTLSFNSQDRCLGKINGDGCVGKFKTDYLKAHLSQINTTLASKNIFAYADSLSDVPLLEFANYPIVTYPDDALLAIAQQRQWEIIC